ncbi:hypothetical protein KUF71_000284 [Frankliniella fusca]|uniref:Uncharacterized protein n=1 Tax=Frankliniella fusca TaxID=407009 RepID=A0AAE1HKY8_9NEOP|nr:hypothetical protein KUF71_000284 [Frankliniella fusca]
MESFITYIPETSTILFGRAWEPRAGGLTSGQGAGAGHEVLMAKTETTPFFSRWESDALRLI